jgi:hypothetical protein
VELLEGRCVPAALLVTMAADTGPGSLRAAIQAANADTTPDTITFDPSLNGGRITATSGPLPTITATGLTIQGPGSNALTVAGNANGTVLTVGSGVSGVTISGLTISDGGSAIFGITSGGGIANDGTLALVGCIVSQNGISSEGFAALGGGIANDGTMTITSCVITGNSVHGKVGSVGAGIDNRGQMTITDSTVSGNVASGPFLTVAGGGISNSGTLTLLRCTVSGNQANTTAGSASGGGVATMGSSVTTIIDCTITGNSSPGGGGVQVLGGTLALTNCTVALNVGGGIALSGGAPAVGLHNTIVAQNTSGPDVSGAVQSGGDNLIGNPAGATGLLPGDRTNVDPLLGPLQSNGGPTQTLALLPGSPAIDAGSNAAPGLPATDQRGLNRVVNNVVDIGAFEYQPPGTTRTLTAAPNPGVLDRPITLTATVAGAAPGSNVPTGFVTFSCRGVTLGTATLSGGTVTLTTTSLPLGDDLVSAVYSGDGNFTGFQSAAVTVRVNSPPPATAGVFDPATATWYLRSSNSAGPPDAGQFQYGGAGWVPVTGDWGNSGHSGVGAFDPATATWYLRNETSAGAPDAGQFAYGGVGWVPITGDWGNSGQTGVGAFDPQTATWYLRNEANAGAPDAGEFRFGVAGGVPVVGDWTGSGHLGIGVFDPATFTWYLRSSPSAGAPDVGVFQYGGVGFKAVAGDWTGAGRAGIGVIDPVTGTWYLRSEPGAGAPGAGEFTYGGAGWLPVCGAFAAPQHLFAAGGEGPGAAALGAAELQAAVAGALARLSAAGVDPALVAGLASAHYDVAALPPGVLGQTDVGARRVTLSADAAGYGWFIDPTPLQDEEFAPGAPSAALPGSAAAGKEDLLSAVLHEMGHLAGRPDGGSGLMAGSLPAGTRDLGALDSIFARQAL